jgi:voltage-gated potassium channel
MDKILMKFTKDFLIIFWYMLIHLLPIWGFLSVVITLFGVVLAKLEGLAIGTGIYFAWITATTVGYGDVRPERGISQFLCVLLAIIGIINTGIILSIALNASRKAMERNLDADKLEIRIKNKID